MLATSDTNPRSSGGGASSMEHHSNTSVDQTVTARVVWSNDKLRSQLSLSGAPTCLGLSFYQTAAGGGGAMASNSRLLLCSAERPWPESDEVGAFVL
jgi:hypothetical protein